MLTILEIIFLNLAFVAIFTGVLINNFEKYVPVFIIKGYRYGSFAYQGNKASFLQIIEIPKAYYKHFYAFSAFFGILSSAYMCAVYFAGIEVDYYTRCFINTALQHDKSAVSAYAAFLAMLLLTIQCVRRFYETFFVQVFAKTSTMNLSHYLAGMIHYYGCILAIIGQAPLFSGTQTRDHISWIDTRTIILSAPCTLIFLWSWHEQYQSNLIFTNLRKDKKTRHVVTEEHKIPNGRMFESVSSPHRLCELIMYTVLLILIPTRTFFCIYLWVLGNQTQTAIQAHEWYKKEFKNYPKTRAAIFPGIL